MSFVLHAYHNKRIINFFTTLADKDNLSLRVIWQLTRPFNEGAASRVVSWQLLAGVMQSLRELIPLALPASPRFLLELSFLWDTNMYLRILAKSPLETVSGFLTRVMF